MVKKTKEITVGIAGNPNSGKTSVFNALTGARQRVANWPGVTVEYREGSMKYKGYKIKFIDLPGTYSLTAYSQEEVVARDYVIQQKPDVVVAVIDTTNLERSLILATQLIELGAKTVIALNMFDIVEKEKIEIDLKQLSKLLGVPMVPTVAARNKGMKELLASIVRIAEDKEKIFNKLEYQQDLLLEIDKIKKVLKEDKELCAQYDPKWLAIKLLEKDQQVYKLVHDRVIWVKLDHSLDASMNRLRDLFKAEPETIIAESRYGFIQGALKETVKIPDRTKPSSTDYVDSILLNRILGLPIFLFIMWSVFQFTFKFAEVPMGWIEGFFDWLGMFIGVILPSGAMNSLVVDGIIAGVGGVLVFLPNILLLFLAISFLEDTGYMARAAFLIDKIMHKIGLHGKSFIPMILGFGCSIPAMMACRNLKNKKDQLTTMLVIPFISCGAKLPVYVLLIGAFFPEAYRGNILFAVYLFGVLLAFVIAKLLKTFLLKGLSEPFVMELPPYRLPTLKAAGIHMWERAWMYIKKAGTLILAFSILIWFSSNYPVSQQIEKDYAQRMSKVQTSHLLVAQKEIKIAELDNERASKQLEYSYAGRTGKIIEPVIRPLGFDWRIGIALTAGFAAKEVVVSTMGTIYSLGETDEESTDLKANLRKDPHFTPLVALSLIAFVLIYVPCMATVAVFRKEAGSMNWTWFMILGSTGFAWLVSFIIYQGGLLLKIGF